MVAEISRFPKDYGRLSKKSNQKSDFDPDNEADDLLMETATNENVRRELQVDPYEDPEDITEIPLEGTIEERSAKQIFADDIARDVVNLQNALVPKEDVPDKIRTVHAKITGVISELDSLLQEYERDLELNNQKWEGKYPKERQEIEKKIRRIAKEIKYWESQAEAVEALNPETIYTLNEILERLPLLDPKIKKLVLTDTALQKDIAKRHKANFQEGPDRQIEIINRAVNLRLLAEIEGLKAAGITVDEQGEPVVGLWGKLTNKAEKIKNTELYQFYKALFDFGKNLQGLALPDKRATAPQRTRRSSNVRQSDFQRVVGVAAGIGSAIGIGRAVMNEDKRPEPLTDETEMAQNSKPAADIAAEAPQPIIVQKRKEEETAQSSRRSIDSGNETTRMVKKGAANAKPREKLSAKDRALADAAIMMDAVERGSATAIKSAEKIMGHAPEAKGASKTKSNEEIQRIERAKDMARAAVQRAIAAKKGTTSTIAKKSSPKAEVPKIIGGLTKGPEMPVRFDTSTPVSFEDGDIEEGDGEDTSSLSNKLLRETMSRANSGVNREMKPGKKEFVGESAKLKLNLGMIKNQFVEVLKNSEQADLWIGKLGIAIDDIIRHTPKGQRAELIEDLNKNLKTSQGKRGLRLLADFARDLREEAVDSESEEAQRIAEKFQDALFSSF